MKVHVPHFHSLNEVLIWAKDLCLMDGERSAPRGMSTFETIGVGFCLTDPLARIPDFPQRHWSLPLAIGELCWHIRASDSLAELSYYLPKWEDYSDDGLFVRGSCYGKKAFSKTGSKSQWETARDILLADESSRRAIIVFDHTISSDVDTLDKSCLTSMQFLIRENRLHALCSMRSNDVFIGLPYDVFSFTMFQELMANDLGIELGNYYHFAGSFHLYERDVDRALLSYNSDGRDNFVGIPMKRMPKDSGINEFIILEEEIRLHGSCKGLDKLNRYWDDFARTLLRFGQKRKIKV